MLRKKANSTSGTHVGPQIAFPGVRMHVIGDREKEASKEREKEKDKDKDAKRKPFISDSSHVTQPRSGSLAARSLTSFLSTQTR